MLETNLSATHISKYRKMRFMINRAPFVFFCHDALPVFFWQTAVTCFERKTEPLLAGWVMTDWIELVRSCWRTNDLKFKATYCDACKEKYMLVLRYTVMLAHPQRKSTFVFWRVLKCTSKIVVNHILTEFWENAWCFWRICESMAQKKKQKKKLK